MTKNWGKLGYNWTAPPDPGPTGFEPFFWWINERHRIYEHKEVLGLPAPWTHDPVMQEYKFCNVFRELDRTTVWIREHIREPYADHRDLWLMLCLARQLNWVPALAELIAEGVWWPGGRWAPGAMDRVLTARRNRGEKCYAGAYMITGSGCPKGWPKVKHTVRNVVGQLTADRAALYRVMRGPSISIATSVLSEYMGWGPFLAYEVTTDLRHCPGWLDRAHDIMTWANPGPGAQRGLHRIHGRRIQSWSKMVECIPEMVALLEVSPLYLDPHVPDLEMRDIEHCLCEFDKWRRGGGKEKFAGGAG